MNKKTRIYKQNIKFENITQSFERRDHNIVHTNDRIDYFEQISIKKKAAKKGVGCSFKTYLRTIQNQLSATFRNAVRYYDLTKTPCDATKKMGK